jgi:TolA-binding protein
MQRRFLKVFFIITGLLLLTLAGCKEYDNFTTYFNTYYNAQRIMDESEDEFEFQEEKKRVKPRVFVPEPKFKATQYTGGIAPFMQEFVISQKQLQPVKIKLDSIIIKGSKILAKHPKSNYIEGTLYLMAKSYFYQGLWLPSQVKCSELVDRFPDGDLVPDALLLTSKNLLMQENYPSGKIMLSRTVDYAWQKKRWDVLSEAFRIQAELALLEDDIDGALRPYRQAIAQSENDELRAKWQVDMASIYYRVGRFDKAAKAFAKVRKYSPDYQAEFEGYLYQAMSLIRIGDTTNANRILKKLENDGKYEEWQSYVLFAKMTKYRIYEQEEELADAEKFADSAYMNNAAINAVYFEKAVDYYHKKNYNEARRFFSRARNKRSMFSKTSNQMYFLLNSWDQKHKVADPLLVKLDSGEVISDTSRIILSQMLFELGRIHEEMNNKDSALSFYYKASQYSPPKDSMTARYIYAWARTVRDTSVWASDSLYQVLAENYQKTEYGKDAMKRLGYTDKYVINKPEEIYNSANSLRRNEEYDMSIRQYLSLVKKYPNYKLSPKALYSVGWIWENNLKNTDSALYYYDMLIAQYPNSVYAQDIIAGVSYLTAIKKGEIKPGEKVPKKYFKAKALNLQEISNREVLTPAEKNPNMNNNGSFNPLDIFTDPGKALNKVIDSFKETGNELKNTVEETFDEVKDPKNLMKNVNMNVPDIPGLDLNKKDSSKTNTPQKPDKKEPDKKENKDEPPH